MYQEPDYLLLSGLQHLCFCPRQCAFIHVEQLWSENYFTASGRILHEKVHGGIGESRRCIRTERDLKIASRRLGVTGKTDAVEFYSDGTVIPIEYKHGKPKEDFSDEVQLCAQAMCLEEMLLCEIPEGSLYYGETRRRQVVAFTPELRGRVRHMLEAMQDDMARGHTPSVKADKRCAACSMKEICLPGLRRSPPVAAYLQRAAEEGAE